MIGGYPTQLDEIDQWLYESFGIIPGACSSQKSSAGLTSKETSDMKCGECTVWGCHYRSTNSMEECSIRNVSGSTTTHTLRQFSLTPDDIKRLDTLIYAIKYNKTGAFTMQRLTDEQCEETLRRFNDLKAIK